MAVNNKLKVLQQNVLAWTTNRKMELLNTYNKLDIDIILLNSHGRKDDERITMKGYNNYQRNSTQQLSDGTAILIKETIRHKILDDFEDQNMLAIEIETSVGPLRIATTYLPPRRRIFPINDVLRLARSNIAVYFLADFNAHHPILGYNDTNNKGKAIFNMINDNYLRHLGPNFETYLGEVNVGTPDIILANRHCQLNYAIQRGPMTTSDHVAVILNLSTSPLQYEKMVNYNTKKANWELFVEALNRNENNETDLQGKDLEEVDNELEKWTQTIIKSMEETVPKTKYSTMPHVRNTFKIRQLKYLYTNLLEYASIHGWSYYIRTRYKRLRIELQTEVNNQIKSENENFINNMDIVSGDVKSFWFNFRKVTGVNHEKESFLLDGRGERVDKDKDKEKLYREIWKEVFKISAQENLNFDANHENRIKNEMERIIDQITPHYQVDYSRLNHDNILIKPITLLELEETLKTVKEKAPGFTGIKVSIIKNLTDSMKRKYIAIVNAALSCGYFPDGWKLAIVKFLPKPGKDSRRPENYRPISLLEVHGKIFEKILNTRLCKYLEINEMYNKNQYGFRKGRGTQAALANIYEFVSLNQKNKNQCTMILRDVSKAFDKVWHLGLKYIIFNMEMPLIFKKILSDFVDDRGIRIKVGGYIGETIEIESGVPQGSCLSPTLYVMYTKNIPEAEALDENVAFADDLTQIIVYEGKSKQMMSAKIEKEIDNINDFEYKWKIKTNTNKFKAISISKTKPAPIHIDESEIEYNNNGSILGYKISSTGSVTHIRERIRMAILNLAKLYNLNNLNQSTKLYLYKALIQPILTYPPVPLHTASNTQMKNMQRIQNKAIRWIKNNEIERGTTMESLHQELKLEAINVRLHKMAEKIWNKIELNNEYMFNVLRELSNKYEGMPEHIWWPSSQRRVQEVPQPVYA